MRISGVVLLMSIAFMPMAHACEDPSSVISAFHHALDTGDKAGALEKLAVDVKIFEQGHVEQSKAEYASHHLESDIAFSRVVKSEVKSVDETLDGELAVVTSQSESHGEFQGNPVNSFGLETMVLRKVGQCWKIVHIHWSQRKLK